MLTRIYVDNYRCFTNFTFEPKQMNLLVGDNGTGKTYLLRLLQDLRMIAKSSEALRSWLPLTCRTRWDKRATQRFELAFDDKSTGALDWSLVLAFDETSGKTQIERETIVKDGALIAEHEGAARKLHVRGAEVPLPYELDGSLLALRIDDPDLRALHRCFDDLVALKLDPGRVESTSSKAAALRFDGTNFVSSYRLLRDMSFADTAALHQSLKTVLDGFHSLDLEDVGQDAKALVVRFRGTHAPQDYTVGFAELSDGQRALIVLYHVLAAFKGSRPIWIDEPDSHVSLRELQPWLQALSSAVEEGTQAFIISHSPEVIDYLAADHAWLFERDDGGPTRVRPLPVDRDSGLKASEQLARGWIRGA